MTVRDRAFWLYLVCLLVIGVALIGGILATFHHPSIMVRDSFIVLDTDTTSLSVQWFRGDVSVWVNSPSHDWRLFRPR